VRRLREINSPVYSTLRVSVLLGVSYARLVTLNPVLYRRYIRAVIEKQARRRSACPAAAYRSRRINDCRARLSGFSSAGILQRRFVAVKRRIASDLLRDRESRGAPLRFYRQRYVFPRIEYFVYSYLKLDDNYTELSFPDTRGKPFPPLVSIKEIFLVCRTMSGGDRRREGLHR